MHQPQPTTHNIDQAHESGRASALNGRPRMACPFLNDDAFRAAWLEGYDQAKEQLQTNDPRGPIHG